VALTEEPSVEEPVAVRGTGGLSHRAAWTCAARMLTLVLALDTESAQTTSVSPFSSDHATFNPSFSFCWKRSPVTAPDAGVGLSVGLSPGISSRGEGSLRWVVVSH